MEELGIEEARRQLGEITDRARFTLKPTVITRNGRPAAVVVSHEWLTEVASLLDDLAEDPAAYTEWREQAAALRQARLAAELASGDRHVIHHIDGNPRNSDLENLRIIDARDNAPKGQES